MTSRRSAHATTFVREQSRERKRPGVVSGGVGCDPRWNDPFRSLTLAALLPHTDPISHAMRGLA